MMTIAAVLACLALPAVAGDTQSPAPQTPTTQSPGVQPGGAPATGPIPNPGSSQVPSQTPSVPNPGSSRLPSQTPSLPNPGSSQLPSQTPSFPNPGANQFPSQGPTAQILNDIRSAVLQTPGANIQGTFPSSEVQAGPIQDLRVTQQAGQIVLTGTVATQAEKDAAGNRARQASGGQVILNQLEVR